MMAEPRLKNTFVPPEMIANLRKAFAKTLRLEHDVKAMDQLMRDLIDDVLISMVRTFDLQVNAPPDTNALDTNVFLELGCLTGARWFEFLMRYVKTENSAMFVYSCLGIKEFNSRQEME